MKSKWYFRDDRLFYFVISPSQRIGWENVQVKFVIPPYNHIPADDYIKLNVSHLRKEVFDE